MRDKAIFNFDEFGFLSVLPPRFNSTNHNQRQILAV